MKNKPYFPLFVDLSDKKVVVVGGGAVATRRVRTLLKFTRNITVIAPQVTPEIMDLGKAGRIRLHLRPVKRTDFGTAYMVLAATNDWKLNDTVYRICKEEGIYVNVASDKEECDFYFPGICMRDGVVAGVTASGLDHKKARRVREAIQKLLEEMDEENHDEEA
ncbi:MAG: bifunctional precorrin-2 dehydrogenase/sirohydrochlorin ferrochelatase [Eubacteriales bacterium]|nr:bifunctional precorrin-2 dehydrogenase/sirohydrochlorin ferrochelatase [Eubacteriales bacterium]